MNNSNPAWRPQPPVELPLPLPMVASRARPRPPRRMIFFLLFGLIGSYLLLGARGAGATPTDTTATGTIAYVDDVTKDEIRLVEPDGSNDRRLWAHGLADPNNVYEVWNMAWRPNAAELAFASTHENWCSINHADIYVVGADGGGYRRVTESPACSALAAFPQGTVHIPVRNDGFDSFFGFVYFQGAPELQQVSLPPGGSTTLTFENVADFGPDYLQIAMIIHAANRSPALETAVNVVAGGAVTTAAMSIYVPDIFWEVYSPTWRSDGGKIGYIISFNGLRQIDPHPLPLDFGQELQTDQAAMPSFVDILAWGPVSRPNQLLYVGNEIVTSEAIYLTTEGQATAGEPLLTFEYFEDVRGLAWLPDGSGFIFAVEEGEFFQSVRANVYEYTFATEDVRPLTNFTNDFAGQLSVSPDGGQIVFERAATEDFAAATDLWLMNRDGSGLKLLQEAARAPAWSPSALLVPEKTYLPVTLRPQ